MGQFDNKVVMITGASGGVASGIITKFAHEGAKLVLVDRDKDAMQRRIDDLGDTVNDYLITGGDLGKTEDMDAVIAATVEKLIRDSVDPEKIEILEKTGDVELIYVIDGGGRFRVTLMKHRSGWDFTARAISQHIPTLEEMKLPAVCAGLTKWAQGLVW